MQNAVNKNKAILIAVAIILTALFVSVAVACLGGGVTYAEESAYQKYEQVVYTNSYIEEGCQGGNIEGKKWHSEFGDSNYDNFEYIFVFQDSSDSDQTSGVVLTDSLAPADASYSGTFSLGFMNSDGSLNAFCEYGGNYYFSQNTITLPVESHVNKLFYLTLSKDRVVISYFGCNVLYDEVTAFDKHKNSLDNVLLSVDKGSALYNFFHDLIFVADNTAFLVMGDVFSQCKIGESLKFTKTMDVPVKEGYTFVGWYYDEAFTRPYNGEAITEDINLYAKYEINRYTVTFDGSELDDSSDPNNVGLHNKVDEVEYGTVIDYVPEYVEGKVFDGWYYEDGTKYDNEPIKSDVVLIGHWRQAKCTITFDLEDKAAELEALEAMEVEYGSIVELPIPTLGEYRVWYWEDVSNPAWNVNEPVTSDLHLIATWEKYIFTVTFYIDSEIYKEVKVEKGKTLGSVALTENIDSKSVVGFENLNSVTVAAEFVKFEVDDDVAVYLSEDIAIDDVPVDNKADMTLWQKFVAQVKAFFEKVGQWFKNLFGKNKS